jgi:hypothetical protein
MGRVALVVLLFVVSTVTAEAQQRLQINLHWITDAKGCKVWDSMPGPNESVTWTGPCLAGYAEGKGKLTWFLNGRPHSTYEGEMMSGHYNGKGIQIWPTGARYEGNWKDDRADGHGTYHAVNGDVCSGEWHNGCFKGVSCNHSVGATVCP